MKRTRPGEGRFTGLSGGSLGRAMTVILTSFLIAIPLMARPFWEKDLESLSSSRVLITVPAELEAVLFASGRPLQFHGFSGHTRRFEPDLSLGRILVRDQKELLELVDRQGSYAVIFVRKEEAVLPLDTKRLRFFLPLLQLGGESYTLLGIERLRKITYLELERRSGSGIPGDYIRLPVDRVFLHFKAPDP